VPPVQPGGGAPPRAGTEAHPEQHGQHYDERLEGRLDLDHLDAPLDLDVIGADPERPLLSEHLSRVLAEAGVSLLVRRHRTAVVAASVVAAVVVAGTGTWWASRPEPLPDPPRVRVTASGSDQTELAVDTSDGRVVGITLDVGVASRERAGVAVQLVSLTGPGLSPPSGPVPAVDATVPDFVATVSASLDCTDPWAVRAALSAGSADFGVVLRRRAPEGEVRDEQVGLIGAQHLAEVVRQTCLQVAAARELRAISVTAAPLDGVAAATLTITVRNTGSRTWPGLRMSTRDLPWVVNARPATDLAAGSTVALKARLWLQDCADPSAALAEGLTLRTSFAADDAVPGAADNAGDTFSLPLGAAALAPVSAAFSAFCSSAVPVATVRQSAVATGGSDASAGTLELTIDVAAQGAAILEIDRGATTAGGRLTPIESPVPLVHGVGTLHATWVLPRCADLLAAGLPTLSVSLVTLGSPGGDRRPYLVPISGEALRDGLAEVCGDTATVLVP